MKVPRVLTLENPIQFEVLPEKIWHNSKGDTTPSVLNNDRLRFVNTGATTVTKFDEGANGQFLVVIGDGLTTIAHGATIKNALGVNKLLLLDVAYAYVFYNNIWYGLGAT